jgi:hypothetical protein
MLADHPMSAPLIAKTTPTEIEPTPIANPRIGAAAVGFGLFCYASISSQPSLLDCAIITMVEQSLS